MLYAYEPVHIKHMQLLNITLEVDQQLMDEVVKMKPCTGRSKDGF